MRNKSQPEGCIAVAVNLDECVSYCSMYMEDSVVTRRNRPGRNYDVMQGDARQGLPLFGSQGKPASPAETVLLERLRFEMAHRYVLVNCPQMAEYLRYGYNNDITLVHV